MWLYRKVVFGVLDKESLKSILDISNREKVILYPLVVLIIFYGVYPIPIFDATSASVDALINNYQAAIDAAKESAQASLSGQVK